MLKRILNEFEYQLGLGQSWSRMISNMIKQKFSITISWSYQSVSSIPSLKSSKIVKSQPSSSATPCCLSLPSLLSSSLREIASALLRIWRRTRSVKKVRPVLNTSVNCGAALPSRSAARRTCAYWCVSWMLTSTPVHSRASWWTMENPQEEADFWPLGIANDLWTPRNMLQWLPRKNAKKSFPNIPRRRWRSSTPPSTLRVASWILPRNGVVSTQPTPTQTLGSSTFRLANHAFPHSNGRWTSGSILHLISSRSYSVERNITDWSGLYLLWFMAWTQYTRVLKFEMSVTCPWVSLWSRSNYVVSFLGMNLCEICEYSLF